MKLRNYLAKYGVRIAVIVILCALVIGLVSSARGGRAGLLRNADGSLKAPLEKATTAALDWLEGVYGYLYEYDSLVEETAALKAENAELREQVRSYAEMETENERLRTLLGFAEKHTDFTLETAKIVSWDASNYTSAFTISKGSDSGVDVGDCVITEYGALVGQVIELGSDWATVRTVIDVDMNVGALVGAYSYAGMVTGEFSLMRQGQTRLTYLASGAQILAGDEALTSGSSASFPAGLLIGTVSAVVSEAGGQVTYGIVEPDCDLDQLSQIFIITDFAISE